jgi:transposase InsO family protein
LSQLAVTSQIANSDFTLKDGVIRYKGRIWLGTNVQLQNKVISALHDSALGGHSGAPVTYRRIKQLFYWKGMKQAIHRFVQTCSICQQAKPDRLKSSGLLSPLPVPPHAWHTMSLDFIEGLPQSANMNCILVVVDKFSKYSHFLALAHPFTAVKVARLFLDQVYRLHGMPFTIVSDRDRIFTSQFWQQLFYLTGTKLNMSSAYHPQTDGQTERVNQCIETYLRCFVHACPGISVAPSC